MLLDINVSADLPSYRLAGADFDILCPLHQIDNAYNLAHNIAQAARTLVARQGDRLPSS